MKKNKDNVKKPLLWRGWGGWGLGEIPPAGSHCVRAFSPSQCNPAQRQENMILLIKIEVFKSDFLMTVFKSMIKLRGLFLLQIEGKNRFLANSDFL